MKLVGERANLLRLPLETNVNVGQHLKQQTYLVLQVTARHLEVHLDQARLDESLLAPYMRFAQQLVPYVLPRRDEHARRRARHVLHSGDFAVQKLAPGKHADPTSD
jgi:hypothetical protein